jgi:hypothetical protein
MKVHKFECKKGHIFFLPLNLPQDMSVFAQTLQNVKCPLCDCGSKDINLHAQEHTVI